MSSTSEHLKPALSWIPLSPPPPPFNQTSNSPDKIEIEKIAEHENKDNTSVETFAHCLTLDDEFIKNGMIQLAILEANRLAQSNPDLESNVNILMVSSIVQPILQRGPICGLVALAMAAQKWKCDVNVSMIVEEAKKRGYSRRGEMFSVQNMASLGNDLLKYQSTIIDTSEETSFSVILTNVVNGDLALVPYDADFNHSPAERRGHAAHWALVFGVTFFLTKAELESIQERERSTDKEGDIPVLFLDPVNVKMEHNVSEFINTLPKERIYVTARQGKSKNVGLWKFFELIKSNQNLYEISPRILQKPYDFALSPIDTSLRNQIIILNRI